MKRIRLLQHHANSHPLHRYIFTNYPTISNSSPKLVMLFGHERFVFFVSSAASLHTKTLQTGLVGGCKLFAAVPGG
jgi:hypothetical protein